MRIISGKAGGIRLSAPSGQGVRPTEDRVKESMFSTIGELSGKVVLDLFAGSGALGLEALSRGAAHVYGFESERRHCAAIESNIRAVEKSIGVQGGYTLYRRCASQVSSVLPPGVRADVVLADPPYETAPGCYGWRELVLDDALAAVVAPGALLVLEHASRVAPPWHPASRWRCLRTRTAGIRAVSYAVIGEAESC